MQVWPLFMNLPTAIRSAASFMRAVSDTIAGDFPPSSRVTEVRFSAAAFITILPTAGLPVKNIWSNGKDKRAWDTATPPSHADTILGSKISSHILLISAETLGVISDGLMITLFPAASAETRGPAARLKG
jgi:hypothetical protein